MKLKLVAAISALAIPALAHAQESGMAKPKRQGRYTWRTVVELHWVVVRLNEDCSESFYSRYDTEEEAKKMAALMDKAAREGRE